MKLGSFQGISAVLQQTFESLLAPLGCAALVQPDGNALFVRPNHAADLATLPLAAGLCHRYLKLEDGDLAIANDPYSGGTVLSDFTLTMGVRLDRSHGDCEILLARRISLPTEMTPGKSLDAEGVRVPPTPLGNASNPSREILQAIGSHPKAPVGLAAHVERAIAEMLEAAKKMRALGSHPEPLLQPANFKTYLADCDRAFELVMARLPLGTAAVSTQLRSGETIKLQLRVNDDRVHFDFGGSDDSASVAITEVAAFGACFAAMLAAVDTRLPLNASTFQHLQVSAPAKTLLSAKPPMGTMRGMIEGLPAISRLVLEAFTKLSTGFKTASSPGVDCRLSLKFPDGRVFQCHTPPGTGASPSRRGADAYNPWSAVNHLAPAPEAWERDWPLRVFVAGVRAGSAGSGKNRGGNGAALELIVLEEAEMSWLDPGLGHRHSGLDNGRAGDSSSIEIVLSGETTRKKIDVPSGSMKIHAGDRVVIFSGGGGGYGAADEPEKDS